MLGLIGSLFMRHEQGFTLAELLVVFALVGLLSVIAVPNFAEMKGQLSASEEIRILTKRLAFVRAEAMRLRCNIRVQFSESGYSIDIYDDGSTEFTHEFLPQTNWSGSIPSGILFNGKGLVRGIGTQLNLSISSRGSTLGLSINQNGYVDV